MAARAPSRQAGLLPLLALLAGGGVLLALGALGIARRFRRYEVTGGSMLPALRPGDWVVVDSAAYRDRPPRPREIALAADPRDPSRTLVKRVAGVEPGGAARLLGDNPDASTDSRTLGAFPAALLMGRVRWRYWPPPVRIRAAPQGARVTAAGGPVAPRVIGHNAERN